MKKRLSVLIPSITAILALLCIVLFFALPMQSEELDAYARQRAAEIWNSVQSKGGSYATKVTINGSVTVTDGGAAVNLADVPNATYEGSVTLKDGVLEFSDTTNYKGGAYFTLRPNGAVKIVFNGNTPRFAFEMDSTVTTYAPMLITANVATRLYGIQIHNQAGDIVLYNGNGSDASYSGNENATVTLYTYPTVNVSHTQGIAIKGNNCANKGYEIILGGKDVTVYGPADAQYGLIDNQSGSITFCQTGALFIANNFDKLFAQNNGPAPTAVRISNTAQKGSKVLFKNIGKVDISVNKGNAVLNDCQSAAVSTEKTSSFEYNGTTYNSTYDEYSGRTEAVVFEGIGKVNLMTNSEFCYGWGQHNGVVYTQNGSVIVRDNADVTIKQTLMYYAAKGVGDGGGAGIGLHVANLEGNMDEGVFVENNAKLSVLAFGKTSAANDAAKKAEFDALYKAPDYTSQILISSEERVVGTWVNYGKISVSENAQFASYATRTGTSVDQCTPAVIKLGSFEQSGDSSVLLLQEGANGQYALDLQGGNDVTATVQDANGSNVTLTGFPEYLLPKYSLWMQNNGGITVTGGQFEAKSTGNAVYLHMYKERFGRDLQVTDGIFLAKGGYNNIQNYVNTFSETEFANPYHCNAIGNVDLGTVDYGNVFTADGGMMYIGQNNKGYKPNTLLNAAGVSTSSILGSADGKTVTFPANGTAEQVYRVDDGTSNTIFAMTENGTKHTAATVPTVYFEKPNMTSYILVRENGTLYMLGGDDEKTYTYSPVGSATGSIIYNPIAGDNDTVTLEDVSGIQEIIAPTGHLTVNVKGTNTLNNPGEGGIRVTYPEGDLTLITSTGTGVLNVTATKNLLHTESGSFSATDVTLNLNGQERLIFVEDGTEAEKNAFTMNNVTMDVQQSGTGGAQGIVHYGTGNFTLTNCTVTANINEDNGKTSVLFNLGNRSAYQTGDHSYAGYTADAIITDTTITATHYGELNKDRRRAIILQSLGSNLTVGGTSKIQSDSRLINMYAANPNVTFKDSAELTSNSSGGDAICIFACQENGTFNFTVTNNAKLNLMKCTHCAIRLTADHPDHNDNPEDQTPDWTGVQYTKSTINFTMNENASLNASSGGQVLYIVGIEGNVNGTIEDTAYLKLNNTGLGGVGGNTDQLFSALRIWTDGGAFTIQDNAILDIICDDKEIYNGKHVAAIDIEDYGTDSTKGTFTIKGDATVNVDGADALIGKNVVLNLEDGMANFRANSATGNVFYLSNAEVNFGSGVDFSGTGNYGLNYFEGTHKLSITKGATIYLSGTTKAQSTYVEANVSLINTPTFHSGCAPADSNGTGNTQFIITDNVSTNGEVYIYTVGSLKNNTVHKLSWNGWRCFDSTNGLSNTRTATTQIYLVAPGRVVFNNINRSFSGTTFASNYNTTQAGAVKGIVFKASEFTVDLIGKSCIIKQATGDSRSSLIRMDPSTPNPLTFTASQTEHGNNGGLLFLQGDSWVVNTAGNLTVEGYASLNIEASSGPAIQDPGTVDELYYRFRGHAEVNIGQIDNNWNMTTNPSTYIGIDMKGASMHLEVEENSEFNLYTTGIAIQMDCTKVFQHELKDSGNPIELLIEIGGHSQINAKTTNGNVITIINNPNEKSSSYQPSISDIVTKTINLYGDSRLNLDIVGTGGHAIIIYSHSLGDNSLTINDNSEVNITKTETQDNGYEPVAFIHYDSDSLYDVQGQRDNLVRITENAKLTAHGGGFGLTNKDTGAFTETSSFVMKAGRYGRNILEIRGSATNDPSITFGGYTSQKIPNTGMMLTSSGSYGHAGNVLIIDNAEIDITAEYNGFYLLSGGSAVPKNEVTITGSKITVNEQATTSTGRAAIHLIGQENAMTVNGDSVLNLNHNNVGIKLEASGENGNRLDILDGVTINSQKSNGTSSLYNICLYSTHAKANNVMNVLQTENGAPKLTLNDSSSRGIYLYHNTPSSTAEQSNLLTVAGTEVEIDVTMADGSEAGIYMFKNDIGPGQNALLVEGATLNIAAWNRGIWTRQPTGAAVGYNNVTFRNATIDINTGTKGIEMDTGATGGNNLTVDASQVSILRNTTKSTTVSDRYGIILTDRNSGSSNALNIQNGANLSVTGDFSKGVDMAKIGTGTNAFNLNEATCTIAITGTDTYGINMGADTYDVSENILAVYGDPATATETKLDVQATKHVLSMVAKYNVANTKNTILFDGDAAVNLENTYATPSAEAARCAIFYTANILDLDILTTGKVYMLGKSNGWAGAAIYDNNKAETTTDILITGSDVTVENISTSNGLPAIAWYLQEYGKQTMTIAENANVTIRGRHTQSGSNTRAYGLFASGSQGDCTILVKDNATLTCETNSVEGSTYGEQYAAGLHLKQGAALTIQDTANVYAKAVTGSTATSAALVLHNNCSILIQGQGYLEANSVVGEGFTGKHPGVVNYYDNATAPITIVKDKDNDAMFVVKSNVATAIEAPATTQVVTANQAAAMGLLKTFTITKEAETVPATGSLLITVALISATVSIGTLLFALRGYRKRKTN